MKYPVYKIKEIVEIKQNPNYYLEKAMEEIIKCDDDGTVISKELRKWIDNFAKDYGTRTDQVVQVLDSNDTGLFIGGYSKEEGNITRRRTYDSLTGTNNHIMKNTDFDDEEGDEIYSWHYDGGDGSWENTFSPMPQQDMLELLHKNGDGEYLFQSTTVVSPNGSFMTLLRNNDFNKKDEKLFKKTVKEFQKEVNKSDWSKTADKIFDEIQEEHSSDMSISDLYKELGKRMKKETGYATLRDYLNSKGFEDKFADCNVRFVMNRNGN